MAVALQLLGFNQRRHVVVAGWILDLHLLAAGGDQELARRQPPAVMQGHQVRDSQLPGHDQRPCSQHLKAMGMDQIEPLLGQPPTAEGLQAEVMLLAPGAWRHRQPHDTGALPLVHVNGNGLLLKPGLG